MRMWSKGSIGLLLKVAVVMVFCSCFAHAQGGACPASSPVAGNNTCFFIAQTGSDSNTGTDEAHPWLHAPGMPNCTSACLVEQNALGGSPGNFNISHPGYGFIFRGGDTWHFSNSSPSSGVYTGGTYYNGWGSNSNCSYEGTQTGCFYIGVDTTWYNSSVCGSSFCRPIFNGDNVLSTSLVSSCTYSGISGGWAGTVGLTNVMMVLSNDLMGGEYLDSIEFTGFCSNDTAGHGNNEGDDLYVLNGSVSLPNLPTFLANLYFHGTTVTTAETTSPSVTTPNCTIVGGGSISVVDHIVIDLSDTAAINDGDGICTGMAFTGPLHVRDSIFRYIADITAQNCHDWHDNIFEYYNAPLPRTHGNMLECNTDYNGSNTANVFYNNIMRHNFPSWSSSGEVTLWFCPGIGPGFPPEYWFNNIQYDLAASRGSTWAVVGGPGTAYPSCTGAGGQFEFNNTIVDSKVDCPGSNNGNPATLLTILNNHMIGSAYWSLGPGGVTCNGGPNSTTNVTMSDSTAQKQGYTTGSSGNAGTGDNCANDATAPCSPTASTNSTVGAGSNLQSYCTTLASYTGETAIGTDAANACKYGTTDGCSYNTSTNTMSCPALTAVARPSNGPWDSGAYEFNAEDPPPAAPTGLNAVVQ